MPSVVLLPKKISAKLSAMIARKPALWIDCGACSRELPQPKLALHQQHAGAREARVVERVRLLGLVVGSKRAS